MRHARDERERQKKRMREREREREREKERETGRVNVLVQKESNYYSRTCQRKKKVLKKPLVL